MAEEASSFEKLEGGLNACTRDSARFGQLYLDSSVALDGPSLTPFDPQK